MISFCLLFKSKVSQEKPLVFTFFRGKKVLCLFHISLQVYFLCKFINFENLRGEGWMSANQIACYNFSELNGFVLIYTDCSGCFGQCPTGAYVCGDSPPTVHHSECRQNSHHTQGPRSRTRDTLGTVGKERRLLEVISA